MGVLLVLLVSGLAYYNFIGVGPRTDVATGAYGYDNGNRLTGLIYTSDGGSSAIDAFGWGYNAGNLVTSLHGACCRTIGALCFGRVKPESYRSLCDG